MISAKNITVEIDGHTLVRNVSMELKPRKLSVILGRNGAGKSTFLKALAGDIRPAAGQVTVEGRSLGAVPFLNLARRRAVMMQKLHHPVALPAIEVVLMRRTPDPRGFE